MRNTISDTPLIVQSDHSILMDVHAPGCEEARRSIGVFADLEKSPEHIHTYRITPISLWNAAAAGLSAQAILDSLGGWSRFPVPANVKFQIKDTMERFGKLRLFPGPEEGQLYLEVREPMIRTELANHRRAAPYLEPYKEGFLINLVDRGTVKLVLIKLGYPVKDEVPLRDGDPLAISLVKTTKSGIPFRIRDYQSEATEAFCADGRPGTGFGTLVLPCGSGKTIIAIDVMAKMQTKTLILATNIAAAHQWIRELLDKTSLTAEEVGEYSGRQKEIKPVTVATYQIVTWRSRKEGAFSHFPHLPQAKVGADYLR